MEVREFWRYARPCQVPSSVFLEENRPNLVKLNRGAFCCTTCTKMKEGYKTDFWTTQMQLELKEKRISELQRVNHHARLQSPYNLVCDYLHYPLNFLNAMHLFCTPSFLWPLSPFASPLCCVHAKHVHFMLTCPCFYPRMPYCVGSS